MSAKEPEIKYTCPLCGVTPLRSRRGLRKHCTHMHKELTPEEFESVWKQCEEHALAQYEERKKVVENGTRGLKATAKKAVEEPAPEVTPEPEPAPPKSEEPAVEKPKTGRVKATKPKLTVVPDVPEEPQLPTSIPTHSRLRINGQIYYQDAESGEFVAAQVSNVLMTVGFRYAAPDGSTWLYCRVDGVVYALDERLVTSGQQELVSLPQQLPVVPECPPLTEVEIEENPRDVEYREKLPEFLNSVIEYHSVKEKEAAVQKLMKSAKEKHYDGIFDFVKNFGTESEKGKQDYVLREGGYRAWLMRCPGRTEVKRNESAIIQWCLDNGHEAVLKRSLDVDAWENLKKLGVVPESAVKLYEEEVQIEDKFRLSVTRDTEDQ